MKVMDNKSAEKKPAVLCLYCRQLANPSQHWGTESWQLQVCVPSDPVLDRRRHAGSGLELRLRSAPLPLPSAIVRGAGLWKLRRSGVSPGRPGRRASNRCIPLDQTVRAKPAMLGHPGSPGQISASSWPGRASGPASVPALTGRAASREDVIWCDVMSLSRLDTHRFLPRKKDQGHRFPEPAIHAWPLALSITHGRDGSDAAADADAVNRCCRSVPRPMLVHRVPVERRATLPLGPLGRKGQSASRQRASLAVAGTSDTAVDQNERSLVRFRWGFRFSHGARVLEEMSDPVARYPSRLTPGTGKSRERGLDVRGCGSASPRRFPRSAGRKGAHPRARGSFQTWGGPDAGPDAGSGTGSDAGSDGDPAPESTPAPHPQGGILVPGRPGTLSPALHLGSWSSVRAGIYSILRPPGRTKNLGRSLQPGKWTV
ncbi:hypothetical protein JHW43_009609 [Diplocarpon mali]|nr:hypothetical protein JHW43_009609 [Diplocarpon mali]